MTRPQIPGQIELVFDVPELTDELRAELAAHVLLGWQSMGACRSVADDTWFPEEADTTSKASALDRCWFLPGPPLLPRTCPVDGGGVRRVGRYDRAAA